jgi:prepilin-type processing-associated H-X9-DG protein
VSRKWDEDFYCPETPSTKFHISPNRSLERRKPVHEATGWINLPEQRWVNLSERHSYTPCEPPQHGKSFNVWFCDGHVSTIKLAVLYNPTNSAQNWNNDHEPHPEFWP